MQPSRNLPALVLTGPAENPDLKAAVSFLERTGLDYRSEVGQGRTACMTWGSDMLTDLSHSRLVEFLWAHGAKFEDS